MTIAEIAIRALTIATLSSLAVTIYYCITVYVTQRRQR